LKKDTLNKKRIWDYPWQFAESFIILSTAVIIAFFFDFITESSNSLTLSYPTNIITLLTFISSIFICYFVFKNTEIIKWLRSGQLAIATIIWLLILVILMGIVGQDTKETNLIINKLQLNNIVFSKAFYIVQFFMLTNLLMLTIYRFNSFTVRNTFFIINHIGIFILIVSLSFGAGDIQKYTVKIDTDNYVWDVTNSTQHTQLPFALILKEFDIKMFPAKIGIIENKTDEIIKGNNKILSSNKDSVIYFMDYKISLKKYLSNAINFNGKYHFVNDQGSAPAANILIEKNEKIRDAWISCGSFMYPSTFFEIDSNYTLVMLEPEPKLFKSDIKIIHKNSKTESFVLEVNQPVNIMGWDIYQTDYNKEMGKWSDYSVIEMVKDPWLNFVYLGIFMMMFGAFSLIFLGVKK